MCIVCVSWTGSRLGQDLDEIRLLLSPGPVAGRDSANCKFMGSLWRGFVNFFNKLQIFKKICSIYLTRRIDSKPLGGLGRDLMP